MTLDGMGTPLRAMPTTYGNPNDVIKRVVKAWMGAYDMTQDEFAVAIGMIKRTFARRLAETGTGRKFKWDEVSRIATFMSSCLGTPVSMDDVYAGRVDVSRAWDDAEVSQVTLPKVTTKLAALTPRPDISAPRRGHLRVIV